MLDDDDGVVVMTAMEGKANGTPTSFALEENVWLVFCVRVLREVFAGTNCIKYSITLIILQNRHSIL